MSEELPLVSQVMYLREGDVKPGDEAKVERLERKLSEWKRNVVRVGRKENANIVKRRNGIQHGRR
jgi:hypothetical protein